LLELVQPCHKNGFYICEIAVFLNRKPKEAELGMTNIQLRTLNKSALTSSRLFTEVAYSSAVSRAE
jgi:hypothetical protein